MRPPVDTAPAFPSPAPVSGGNGICALELARSQGVPLEQLARSIVLRDRGGFLQALYPADARISLSRIRACTGRFMEIAARSEYASLLPGGELPGLLRGVETVLDQRLLDGGTVYLETAAAAPSLLPLPVASLRQALPAALVAEISQPLDYGEQQLSAAATPVTRLLEERLASLVLPAPLQSLLQWEPVPAEQALVRELARLPDLASMIILVAREPLFGGDARVLTLQQAVTQLGVDLTLGWVAGLGIGAGFRPATSGLRGHIAYWRDAFYTTALLWLGRGYWEESPGTVVMAGLMHNFGYILLGYLDPERFRRFNRLLAQAPERPVQEMELLVSGDNHCRLGARLSQMWQLPDAVSVAICEHHNPHWQGPHRGLAGGVLICNRVLRRYGIGDARHTDIPATLLSSLALDNGLLQEKVEQLLDNCTALDALALQMAHLDLAPHR